MADARWLMIERMLKRKRREGAVRKIQEKAARGSCVWSRIGRSKRATAPLRILTSEKELGNDFKVITSQS